MTTATKSVPAATSAPPDETALAWDVAALQAELPRHVLTGSMRYSDFESLGQGGKAEVFRCRDVNLGRCVAMKVLHHSLIANVIEQQMLVREARIMAALNHRAVPSIHDLGRDQHARPYYTMSLVEGKTLHELLTALRRGDETQRRLLTTEQLLAYLLQVGETLAYVHRQGIVHGDIKPENLIINDDGIVSLVDWGLATLTTEPHAGEQRLEQQWGRQGSPLYMSPEQVAGEPFLQPMSDVYSLGALLYECLTLQSPLHGQTARDTLKLVAEVDPEPPSRKAPEHDIPLQLEYACMRALSKSPTDRFSSMDEFCELLQDCHLDLLISYEREH